MKKMISGLLCIAILLCLSGCTYHPPEGWTKKHHMYEEVLAFATAIDPEAVVWEEHTDTLDENDWEYREWNAVINGVDCHVASVSDWVWNDGFIAGEFVEVYYRMDTDYDYVVLQNILAEKYPDWKVGETIRGKYHQNTNTLFAELVLPAEKMLSDDELEQVWQMVLEIDDAYTQYAIGRKVGFQINTPGTYVSQNGDKYVDRDGSNAYIVTFTEEGKNMFFQEYHEKWALLDSGLPIMP